MAKEKMTMERLFEQATDVVAQGASADEVLSMILQESGLWQGLTSYARGRIGGKIARGAKNSAFSTLGFLQAGSGFEPVKKAALVGAGLYAGKKVLDAVRTKYPPESFEMPDPAGSTKPDELAMTAQTSGNKPQPMSIARSMVRNQNPMLVR